jgi:hypothetical protein
MTPNLNTWAKRHNISAAALKELAEAIAPQYFAPILPGHSGEADTQARLRVTAGRDGWPLWRNNNGACMDDTGRMIRYGLGNDSKRVSDKIKSSDLIGPCPIEIGVQHLGRRVAVFTAIEVKHPLWKKPVTARDRAQEKYHEIVKSLGGFAGFATHESHLRSITNGPT